MPNNTPNVIFFIGAGFSKPAGVPLMTEFVTEFADKLKNKGTNYINYFNTIKKMMAQTSGQDQPDLEILMDILYRLAQGDTLEMSAWKENDELASFNEEIRNTTRIELENLIREKCVIDPKTKLEGYSPLNEIFKAIKPLDIFSVNYDDVLEVFCYKNKYTLEDGFALYWDPKRFADLDRIDVRLFKVHGSVLWYRTKEGAFYKVLLDVPSQYNKLITGEQLEQLIAYPVAGKPIHVAPLAYTMNELRKRLEEVSQCIIIGYSMRDKHILDIFVESLRRNERLKIILVSPDPFSILKTIKHEALLRSITPAFFKTEEILHENKLLRISNFVKIASEQPLFESMKIPLKAAQEYFQALDYQTALMLVKTERFWRDCEGISARHLDYPNILAGLSYSQMIGQFTDNQTLRDDASNLIVKFFQSIAKKSKREYYDLYSLLDKGIQANKWAGEYLQGNIHEKVENIVRIRTNVLKNAISEIERNKDQPIEQQKKIVQRYSTILFKWSTEPVAYYDDDISNWLFGNNGD
jgi:hypothetical protein